MPANDRQREYRREMLVASTLIAAGLAISALAITVLNATQPLQIAQATPPTQSTPGDHALSTFRAGHDRSAALGYSASAGPSRPGRAKGRRPARVAAGTG